ERKHRLAARDRHGRDLVARLAFDGAEVAAEVDPLAGRREGDREHARRAAGRAGEARDLAAGRRPPGHGRAGGAADRGDAMADDAVDAAEVAAGEELAVRPD